MAWCQPKISASNAISALLNIVSDVSQILPYRYRWNERCLKIIIKYLFKEPHSVFTLPNAFNYSFYFIIRGMLIFYTQSTICGDGGWFFLCFFFFEILSIDCLTNHRRI